LSASAQKTPAPALGRPGLPRTPYNAAKVGLEFLIWRSDTSPDSAALRFFHLSERQIRLIDAGIVPAFQELSSDEQ